MYGRSQVAMVTRFTLLQRERLPRQKMLKGMNGQNPLQSEGVSLAIMELSHEARIHLQVFLIPDTKPENKSWIRYGFSSLT